MTIRKVSLFAGALVALSGCASMDVATSNPGPSAYVPNRPSTAVVAQNAANATGTLPPAATKTSDAAASAADQLTPGQSPPMRIYWFLGGR